MQNFVQKVVEGYIFFLFFGGLWLFSLMGSVPLPPGQKVYILAAFKEYCTGRLGA